MKRLFLLLILFPAVLLGQSRRKDVVDSIKAAAETNLQSVSKLISNNRNTKVSNIHVTDSGDYITIVVHVRVAEAGKITALTPLTIAKIKTETVVVNKAGTVTVPPLPDMETLEDIPPCAITRFKIENIVANANTADIPLLPDMLVSGSVPLVAINRLKTEQIAISDVDTGTVPALPDMEVAEDLSPLAAIQFKVENIVVAARTNTATIPPIPDMDAMEELPLFAAINLPVQFPPLHKKMHTVAIPHFEEKKFPVGGMHLSEDGYSLLEKLEGFSPELYSLKDGGFTIGFGFFVPYGEGAKWTKGVTWEESERLIREKVPQYEDQVKQYINVPLTQNEFDALTMFAYNLGGFAKATSIVNDVNSQADFDKLRSDWNRFIHSKAPGVTRGLMNRRRDEIGVRNESDYQPERKIQILKIRQQ